MEKMYRHEETLRYLYVDRGYTQQEIANKLSCGKMTVSRWLNKFDIETRNTGNLKLDIDKNTLTEMYVCNKMSESQIAKHFDCSQSAIHRYLKRYNIDTRKQGGKKELNITKDILIELYVDNGLTTGEIAEKFSCHETTISGYIKQYDIEIRGRWHGYEAREDIRNKAEHIQWRNSVYERDNYTCQDCGRKNTLHAHHVVPWSESEELRYDIENGVTLCKDCHADRHEERGDAYHALIRNSYFST